MYVDPPGGSIRIGVPGMSRCMTDAKRPNVIGPEGSASRYRSSTIPRDRPMDLDTNSSLQPTTGSGTTAPTSIVRAPNVIDPPTPRWRSRALDVPSTASPERNARVTSSRTFSGTNGAYAAGSTEKASIGIAYGGVGRSTTFPSPSWEAVIHRVSPATTTVVPSGVVAPALASMPGGSEPVIHASHASGICAEGSAPPEGAGCAAGDRRGAGDAG